MVALNKHFAPENPHSVEENRVGDFFADKAKSSRVNRLSAQQPRLEKAYGYDETASGMFFYGFRYYDAETGRWPSRDPIGERGGVNIYAMVGNDSVNAWDFLGLEDISFTVITFIPTDYVEDPLGFLYEGDGGANNTSVNRSTKRTKQTVTVDLDSGTISRIELDQGESVRYRRPNFFEKAFSDYESRDGVWYNSQFWLEDARATADASGISASIRSSSSRITLTLEANVSDPVAPTGSSVIAAVDYRIDILLCRSGQNGDWTKFWKGNHDSFPSYLFFEDSTLLRSHDASSNSPLGLVGPGQDIQWIWTSF